MSVVNKESKIAEGQNRERVKDSTQGYLSLLFLLLNVIFEILLTLFQEIF
jgi:hypothetical protein